MSEASESRPTQAVLTYPGTHCKPTERVVNLTLHLDDFRETPGFAWLVLAANAGNLTMPEVSMYLGLIGPQHGRSASWLQRHRKLFQRPGTSNVNNRVNADGKDEQAIAIMRRHPNDSARYLVKLLRERGIHRTREWVQFHRVVSPA